METYSLEFEINELPKTINAIGRRHWAVKVKEAKKWINAIQLLIPKSERPSAPLKKAKLKLIRMSSSCPDSDGLVSSFKHVIDGLIKAEIIEDDKFINIGMPEYSWQKAPPKQGKIRIIVESTALHLP